MSIIAVIIRPPCGPVVVVKPPAAPPKVIFASPSGGGGTQLPGIVECLNAAPGNYTPLTAGMIFTNAVGAEIFRVWGSDPDWNNYNSLNLYIGTQAGAGQPTANDAGSGFANTGVGFQAMLTIGAGFENTALGQSAMGSVVDGFDHTAVGANALYYQTGGIEDTAVGAYALCNLDNPLDVGGNVVVGGDALGLQMTGDQNTAVGYCVGYGPTSTAPDLRRRLRSRQGPQPTWVYANEHSKLDSRMVLLGAYTGRGPLVPADTPIVNGIAIGHNTRVDASNTAVIGNLDVTDVFFGSSAGNATIHAKNIIVDGVPIGGGGQLPGVVECPDAAPGYSLANSGLVFANTEAAPAYTNEIFRVWGTDPDDNNWGSWNLFIGSRAAENFVVNNVDSGYYNTGVGAEVFSALTTGVANDAFGADALYYLTTGLMNSAFGFCALSFLTTGSGNVGVGANAGVGTGTLRERGGRAARTMPGSSVIDNMMVFVGQFSARDSAVPADTVLENGIALGFNARVAASNTAVIGNSSMTDVYFGSAASNANIFAKSITAKGVNSLVLSGSAAGAPVVIQAIGADANVAIHMKPKNRPVNFGPDLATSFDPYNVSQATVRNTNATGRAHTYEVVVTTVGSDAAGAQTAALYCTADSGVGALNDPAAVVPGTFFAYAGAPAGRTLNRLIGVDTQTTFRGAGTVNETMGLRAKAWNVGIGVVTNMYGVGSYVNNYSTGTVVNAIGANIFSGTNTGGGVLTNLYGLKIDNQTAGVNNWALKTGTGKVEFGDAVVCPALQVTGLFIASSGAYFAGLNATTLTLSGQSVTGSASDRLMDISTTWNTSGLPTAIMLNVNNTASAPAARLLDLQVASVSKMSVDVAGTIYTRALFAGLGSVSAPSIAVGAADTGMFSTAASGILDWAVGGVTTLRLSSNGFFVLGPAVQLGSTGKLGWGAGVAGASSTDTGLSRFAAGYVEINNGTPGQVGTLVCYDVNASHIVNCGYFRLLAGAGSWNYFGAGINLPGNSVMGWVSSPTDDGTARDVGIVRNAAGVLEINKGVSILSGGTYGDLKFRYFTATPDGVNTVTLDPANSIVFAYGGGARGMYGQYGIRMANSCIINWTSANDANAAMDTGLFRNAAGVVEINNGTAGQFRDLRARVVTVDGNSYTANAIVFANATPGNEALLSMPNAIVVRSNSKRMAMFGAWTLQLASDISLCWGNAQDVVSTAIDSGFSRNAPSVMEVNNGGLVSSGGAFADLKLRNIIYAAPAADGTASGPTTSDYNCGYTSSVIGELVYLDASFTWQKASASPSTPLYKYLLGIALEVKATGQAMKVALPGATVWASAALPALNNGPVYMSETAGALTQTAPTTVDAANRVIGWGVHADKLYFFPSPDFITRK